MKHLWLCLAAPLPAVVLGVFLMRHDKIPAWIWGQNLLAATLLTIICAGLLLTKPSFRKTAWRGWAVALSIILLLLTFTNAGMAGVHRWIQIGPVRLHAGAIVLPVLIIALGSGLVLPGGKFSGRWDLLLACGVTFLLTMQPDAAQATAFAGAMLATFAFSRRKSPVVWFAASAVVAYAIWAWLRPDPLPPVRYVEGIVRMAYARGTVRWLAAVVSLALLPLPFLFTRQANGRMSPVAVALGIYILLILVAPWFGTFPVPLLGYGLSPIIGYFLALAWLLIAHRPTGLPAMGLPERLRWFAH